MRTIDKGCASAVTREDAFKRQKWDIQALNQDRQRRMLAAAADSEASDEEEDEEEEDKSSSSSDEEVEAD